MDFRTFARIIAVRWKIVIAAILACLVGAATVTAIQTKSYQASATILMSLSGASNITEIYQATQTSQQRLSSYAEIAGSRTVAQRVVDQLHVPLTADQLVDDTKVTYTPESLLFQITVTDSDPQRVATLAGAMADQFAALVPEVETAAGAQPIPYAYATILERPTVPSAPVRPVPMRNLAQGLVAGLLLAVALALIRDATDRTVRTREALERASGVPLLAQLPRFARTGTGSQNRAGHSAAGYEESLRGLRTRLLAPSGSGVRSVLMTGPVIDDEATTTPLNLSISLTEIGETVVLVDGDPRRPTIARLLDVQPDAALADVVGHHRPVDSAVCPTSHAGLSVVASSESTEANWHFGTSALTETVEKLRASFDWVVIAGPPTLATADVGILAGAVEATVLVVRAGKTTVDDVSAAMETLRAAGGNVVGTVLTDARLSRQRHAATRAYQSKASESA